MTLYVRSSGDIDLSVSLTSSNGSLTLASENIMLETLSDFCIRFCFCLAVSKGFSLVLCFHLFVM